MLDFSVKKKKVIILSALYMAADGVATELTRPNQLFARAYVKCSCTLTR